MPVTTTGKRVLNQMRGKYGLKKGTQVFHSSINKGVAGSEKWHNPKTLGPTRERTTPQRLLYAKLRSEGQGQGLGTRQGRSPIGVPIGARPKREDYANLVSQRQKKVGRASKILRRVRRRTRWKQVGR